MRTRGGQGASPFWVRRAHHEQTWGAPSHPDVFKRGSPGPGKGGVGVAPCATTGYGGPSDSTLHLCATTKRSTPRSGGGGEDAARDKAACRMSRQA
jgi:hypothetical protein